MITLNLISPAQQRYLKMKALYFKMGNLLGLMIIAVIAVAIILIPINHTLTIIANQISYQRKQANLNNKILSDKIKDLNKKIEVLDIVQNENYPWSKLLARLAELTPDEVAIIQFNAQASTKKFILQGFAKNRTSYLAFKENLDKSGDFYELTYPLADILKKEEITFEINGQFK